MPKTSEYRWAVLAKFGDERFLAGKYCWTAMFGPKTPTFPTRDFARRAIRRMGSYRRGAVPVKVAVTVATTERSDDAK